MLKSHSWLLNLGATVALLLLVLMLVLRLHPAPVTPHSAQLDPNANPQFSSPSTATPAESLGVRDAAVAAATAAAADNSNGLGTTEPSQPAILVFPKRDFGKTGRATRTPTLMK